MTLPELLPAAQKLFVTENLKLIRILTEDIDTQNSSCRYISVER